MNINDLFSITNKNVIVTGCSQGIGFEIAESFQKLGANVYGFSRTIPKNVFSFKFIECDLANHEELSNAVNEVMQLSQGVDTLVNCAGVTFSSDENNFDQRLEVFNKTIDINLRASFVLIEKVASFMKKNKNGSIINVTSIAAEFGFPGNPSYVASKGGLKQMSKAFAVDLGEFGIRVNNLCPGYIHTKMTTKSFNDVEKHNERLRNMILPRWGNVKDLVGAAVFLASDASSYVTGSDIVVDGGWSAKGMC